MKTLKWSLVLLATGVGVLTVMLPTRSPRPLVTDANESNRSAAVSKTSRSAYQTRTPSKFADRSGWSPAQPRSAPDKTDMPAPDIASESANVVRVRADQV